MKEAEVYIRHIQTRIMPENISDLAREFSSRILYKITGYTIGRMIQFFQT